MGIAEGGSYWCGGPHPDNFADHRLADARTGKTLLPEALLRGFVTTDVSGATVDPRDLRPSEDLIRYVIANREKLDEDEEKDCGFDDLIRSNFAVYFAKDALVFTLQDLPHPIFSCTEDLLHVPLKEARPLLTDAGAGYFEVLDR